MPKFCRKCGEQLPDSAGFCGNCGTSVLPESPVRQPPVQQPPVQQPPVQQPPVQQP
ncbi:MAG: zinc ribbon domain-containing protein, partial [Ruminiclostridium sp.]|nr:zinc ribbon domain-containing protein [Ruminiclostridium sp.]